MAVTVSEAKSVVIAFCRAYPVAAQLAYAIRDTAEELYGPKGAGLDMLGGYITGPGLHPGRCDIPCSMATDTDDLVTTLRHEVIGHFGLNTFTAEDKRAVLGAISEARQEPSMLGLWAQVDTHYAGRSESIKAEEVFALYCEGIEPSHHIDRGNAHERGERSFRETCADRSRPLTRDDLENITVMVAQGLHDRTRSQRNFPEWNQQFRQEKRMEAKKPFHEQVAEKLIEQLRAGTAPWQKPWTPGEPSAFIPMNPTTGKRYKGINAIYLMAQGHTDQRWMTYKQAAAAGGQVRKGEKGTPIQYWKFSEQQTKTDAAGKPVLDAKGEPVKIDVQLERPRVFFATVFNASQIDGLPPPAQRPERPEQNWTAVERAESILAASGAKILHGEGDRAFYRPATDSIHLPEKAQFPSADGYYATALHELGHWTGHPSRLDRDLAHPFGSEGYAKEELRAEIASMILGDELGIGHDPGQHAAYVGSWIKVLQEDPLEIFRASADAEKIQTYVLGLEQKQVQEQTAQQATEQQRAQQQVAHVPEEWRGEACRLFDEEMARRLGQPGYDRAQRLSSSLRQYEEMSFEPSEREKAILESQKQEIEEATQWVKENVLQNPLIKERMYETVRDFGRDTGDQAVDQVRHEYLAEMEASRAQQPEQHYSDLTLNALVENHGWEVAYSGLREAGRVDSVSRMFDGVGPLGTQVTPEGERRLSAGYNEDSERRRYITLKLGDEVIVDVDGRDQNPVDVARQINTRAEQYADQRRIQNGLDPIYGSNDTTPPLQEEPSMQTPEAQTEGILSALENAGWTRNDGTAIASKPFDTVNGRNDALAYLTEGDGINRTLQFQYTSEGRNVTEADGTLIPVGATAAQAAELAAAAAGRAEKTIQGSYGVRIAAMLQSEDDQQEKALQAARLHEEQVRRDPNSSDEDISAAKTARKNAEMAAALNDPELQRQADALEREQQEQAQDAANERGQFWTVEREPGDRRETDRMVNGADWWDDKAQLLQEGAQDEQDEARGFAALGQRPAEGAEILVNEHDCRIVERPAMQQQAGAVESSAERQFINVPFKEKDEAKQLGAKWDRQERAWYVPAGVDAGLFEKWAGKAKAASESVQAAPQEATQEQGAAQGRTYLAVPYGERQAAKVAGAQWDKAAKSWYAGEGADMDKLQRWLPERVESQQGPAMTPEEEFADALKDMGADLHTEGGQHPIMDGKKQRMAAVDDKKGERAIYYVGHLDGHPAGYIKNNRSGVEMKWKAKGYSLDPAQKAAMQAEAAQKLAERAAELERAHEQAATRVQGQMDKLQPVTAQTPYLQAKGVEPAAGVFTDKEGKTTYIPAVDADGKQWTMQYIQEDGTKRFAKDSKKEGCFHAVGGMDALAAAPAIVIGEGYATAKSLSDAVGFATVAAFDSGNLDAVAKALHEKFPDKPIIIGGDDDKHLEQTLGTNPGKTKAQEAARAVGGTAIFPIFAPGEKEANAKGFTDFNDLANKSSLGKDGVVRQVRTVVEKAIERHQEQHQAQQQEQTQEKQQTRKPRAARIG